MANNHYRKILTRNDLIKNREDIVIFRIEKVWWLRHSEYSTTIFKHKNPIDDSYFYEQYKYNSFPSEMTYITSHKIDNKIVSFIQNNMEELKWIWELEETEWSIFDGYTINLYFSDWKEGLLFSYDESNNFEWKNMKKLLKIKKNVEDILELYQN
jgi:hypothetical protein